MSNIHLYSDQVLYNVRAVLCHVRDNQGQASAKFWQREAQALQGSWGTDVCNIARQAMGREGLIFEGKASERQLALFVKQAMEQNADVLHEIAELRQQPAPIRVFIHDEEDLAEAREWAEDERVKSDERLEALRKWNLGNQVLNFGKWVGMRLSEVPQSYLRWLVSHINNVREANRVFVGFAGGLLA